jgi:hypothetical protein
MGDEERQPCGIVVHGANAGYSGHGLSSLIGLS